MNSDINYIYCAFLEDSKKGGRLRVIHPATSFEDAEKEEAIQKDSILNYQLAFKENGFSVDTLLTDFFLANRQPVPLNLASNLDNEYFVDCDLRYQKLLGQQPNTRQAEATQLPLQPEYWLTLSVPVIDNQQRVMIYSGTYWYDIKFGIDGIGWLHLMHYKHHALHCLHAELVWMT